MRTTPIPRIHYMKLGADSAYCGTKARRVQIAYDEWVKVTCSDCLAHPAAPNILVLTAARNIEAAINVPVFIDTPA